MSWWLSRQTNCPGNSGRSKGMNVTGNTITEEDRNTTMRFTFPKPTVTDLGPAAPNVEEAYKDAVADVRNYVRKLERRANTIAAQLLKVAERQCRYPAEVDIEGIARQALDKALADMAAGK